jgi:16S rRNA (cytosine967-C5)-methyltransferase
VAELTAKQTSILASAARLVKPGGRLVYATCSVLEAENQAIVAAFLDAHPQFVLKPVSAVLAEQKIDLEMGEWFELYPHLHQTDGFFAAVLERTVNAPAQAADEFADAAEAAEPDAVADAFAEEAA